MTGACKVCGNPIDLRGRALTCSQCREEIVNVLSKLGHGQKWISNNMGSIVKVVKEKGFDALLHLDEQQPKKEPVAELSPVDVLTTYLALVQKWRESDTNGVLEKRKADEDAARVKADIDTRTAIHKDKLDSYTRTNAAKLEPLLREMAPLLEQKAIEKQREADKVASEAAAERRRQTAIELRDTS